MQFFLRAFAAALALCLLSTAAARAQARIEDCEKIQAADAYNQCLAKFGPTSKVKSVEPLKPGDIKDNSAEAAAGAKAKAGGTATTAGHVARHAGRGRPAHGRGRHAVAHGGHRGRTRSAGKPSGRKRMVITIRRHR